MRTIFHYMKSHRPAIALVIVIKLIAALAELAIPYILEHMIDRVVPRGAFLPVLLWGFAMAAVAFLARQCNVFSNSTSVTIARDCTEKMRQDLFLRTVYLSGSQIDTLGLPSLISRMSPTPTTFRTLLQISRPSASAPPSCF